MADILVLIHTVSSLVQHFDRVSAEMLPGVVNKHILDEPLGELIRQRGGLAAPDAARLWDHVKMAETIRARAVLVTCSTLSVLVDKIRPLTSLPMVKIEDAMIAAAVKTGSHIGILATNPLALNAVQQTLEAHARQIGKDITCEAVLVPGAFEALMGGEAQMHHRLVSEAVHELVGKVDGVVLAQASMSGVLELIPDRDLSAPVFSSPRLALAQVRDLIGNLGWG